MIRKTNLDDRVDPRFARQDKALVNILMRTSAEQLDGINELLELQARQIGGRPVVVLPRHPDAIH
jgi:hypothetical protein